MNSRVLKSTLATRCLLVGLAFTGLAATSTPGSAEAATARGRKALAESYDLPTPKRLTVFRHPVIYASPEVYTKKVSGKLIIRQTLIIKWGLHVFELAEGLYQCAGTRANGHSCEWVDHSRIATYANCDVSGVSKGEKPNCSGKISGNSGPIEDIREDIQVDPSPDSTSESGRHVPNEWSEFPERHHDPENPIP